MFAVMFVFLFGFNRFFLISRKKKTEKAEGILEELMVDIVGMKEVIILTDSTKKEMDYLASSATNSMKLAIVTSKLILASQLFKNLMIFLTVPILFLYTFYTVNDANSMFQILVVILCCFQFNVAFQKLYLLENQTDEFNMAAKNLREVIDTTGLEFLLGKYRDDRDVANDDSAYEKPGVNNTTYTPEDNSLIELRDLSAAYHTTSYELNPVLQGMNLSILQGQRVVILGETVSVFVPIVLC